MERSVSPEERLELRGGARIGEFVVAGKGGGRGEDTRECRGRLGFGEIGCVSDWPREGGGESADQNRERCGR